MLRHHHDDPVPQRSPRGPAAYADAARQSARPSAVRCAVARGLPLIVVSMLAAATVAACGSSSSGSSSTASHQGSTTALASSSSGVLKFGINTGYPPWDEYVGNHFAGADYALGQEISRRLHMRASWSQIDFGALITSLQTGRINLILSGMSDTKEREKVINFVDYYGTPWGFLVLKGNPKHVHSLSDLCGVRASAESGTVGVTLIQKQSTQCTKEGKPPVTLSTYQNVPEIELAIRSGRTDVDLENFDALNYAAHTLGGGTIFQAVQLTGIPSSPYGIGVAKSDPKLQAQVKAALQSMINDGTYQRILRANGITAGFATSAKVDGAAF